MELHLAETLAREGITDARVLAAIMRVDREPFVPTACRTLAHEDTALPIGQGQTISQPFVVATMTSALGVAEGSRVLEVGTGSGYQAAVLAELGCEVFSIERIPELAELAALTFLRLGLRVEVRVGDGRFGWPEEAPFDGILVTAATHEVPQPLLDQLRPGARLVAPVGPPDMQQLTVVTRTETGFESEPLMHVAFVPLLPG